MKLDLDLLRDLEDPNYSQEMRVWMAAKLYIGAGIPVLPIRPGTKILPPYTSNVGYGQAAITERVVDKWFHPENGRFAGWNIGIGCGKTNGVFVVDVDMKSEGNGFDTLRELTAEFGDLPDTVIQKTPGGGQHFLFRWQEHCVGSTGKIGKFIDTRGGVADQCKSHIVAFPSIVNGKMYKWVKGGEVADVPEWVMVRMGVAWKPRATAVGDSGRGNEGVSEDDVEKQIPLSQAIAMLEAIDPNNLEYDQWLQIGQAINTQHPGEDGLEVWDQWSQRGEKYEERECYKRWRGFDGTGNIRIGTLYHFAKQGGWGPKPDDVVATPMDELVAAMNQQYGVIQIGGKVKILRKKERTAHLNAINFDLMDRDSFHALYQNRKRNVINPTTGKPGIKTEAEIWMAHHARREYSEGIGCFPNTSIEGYYNVWQGFGVAPIPGDVEPFIRHTVEIICNGDAKLADWVLDWCAFAVQRPDVLVGTSIVMRGAEGTGKGLFANTFGALWGSHFIHMIDEHHLTGNFNAHMMNAIVIFADEVVWGGNKKAASKIKGLVSEDFLMYEMKGVDAFPGTNHVHLIMATNEEWAVPAGAHSRRWCVLDVSNKKRGDTKYGEMFVKWRKNKGLEALLHYLKYDRVIEDAGHLFVAPETEAVSEQRDMHISSDSVAAWWMEIIAAEDAEWYGRDLETGLVVDEGWPDFVLCKDVYSKYTEWCAKNNINRLYVKSPNTLYRRLRKYGLIGGKQAGEVYRLTTGTREYVFSIPNIRELKQKFKEETGITLE